MIRRQMPRQGGRYARQSIANSEGTPSFCCADPVRRIRALRLRAIRDAIIGWIEAAVRTQFQLNLYQDFTEGKALSVKTSVFRWNDNHYSLVSVVSLHEEDPQA